MKRYLIPAGEARAELTIVNSRFIASAASAFSVEEARAFIERIKAEFPDASHNVPAYLIGYGSAVIAHCSDAGEPTGTAGRPALAVLLGSDLGDVVVVVTRYFGGTKLGTGGLVRAYSDAVRKVLAVLPRAEKIPTYTTMAVIPYNYYTQVKMLIAANAGEILDEEFAGDISLTIRFKIEVFDRFQDALRELTRGAIEAAVIETNPDTIFPIR